jgi:hypothetical protein
VSADGYEVGYKKPPRHTRFQKGRSGNPKGRPRGARNLFSDLEAELRQPITVREGDATRRVSRQRAVLKRLLDKALKGELGAIVKLLELVARRDAAVAAEALAVRHEPDTPLSAEERQVLAALEARLLHRPEAASAADVPAPPRDPPSPAEGGEEEPSP